MTDQLTNCITFNSPPTEEVLRLDKEGFHYRGQFIADAGEAHRLMVEFLKQNTATSRCDAKPRDLIRRFIDALEMLMKWECWYEKDELDLLAEARAYLDQPEPQNAPMTDFRALCTELLCSLEQYPVQPPRDRNLIDRIRAALAKPEEQRPTDEELVELFNDNDWNYISPETFLNIARSVLELR
jgi:hypothetical protein